MTIRFHFCSVLLLISLWITPVVSAEPAKNDTSDLFQLEYQIADKSFCNSMVCVDFNNDGQKELLFASRKTHKLQMLNAIDGKVIWSKELPGDQQSLSAYDLNQDGRFEILYTVSNPGSLYILDGTGKVLNQWNSGDWKLGHSAIIADVDRDGQLDGLFGSRSKHLFRLNLTNLSLIQCRPDWQQCGGHTTAMDVDYDGQWDLFAGSGDDSPDNKGVLHRYDPLTLKSLWSFKTDDNASSADPVLTDIDHDGQVEIIKSVDNYAGDTAHDAVYAFETDGTLIWKVPGLSGEDSPTVADLNGDGEVEIIGMTFNNEVYCLDSSGNIKWQKALRPELSSNSHAYLTPIICDLDGKAGLEILALTNGGYYDSNGVSPTGHQPANGVVYALSSEGKILDKFDVGGPRYWGDAFVCNIDSDPWLELIISGSGGLDVLQTKGLGPDLEQFQRRRNYQRINVLPWAYADSYFIYRGTKEKTIHLTDNLTLSSQNGEYVHKGKYTTELFSLPPDGYFNHLQYQARTPEGTTLSVNLLNESGQRLLNNLSGDQVLKIAQPVKIEFEFKTNIHKSSPILDSYELSFNRFP